MHGCLVASDVVKGTSGAIILAIQIGKVKLNVFLEYGAIERHMVVKKLIAMEEFISLQIRGGGFTVIIVMLLLVMRKLDSKVNFVIP